MTADEATGLSFDSPARRWTDALPLGNGRLGAMCFGGAGLDRFQLNEATCWTGSPATARETVPGGPRILRAARDALAGDDVREAEQWLAGLQGGNSQAYQPLADLWIEQPAGVPVSYRRRLDLRTAVASHTYSDGDTEVSQEAWISAPAQALVIRRRTPHAQQLRVRLNSPHLTAVTSRFPGRLELVARMPADASSPASPGPAVTAVVGVRLLVLTGEVIIVVGAVTDYVDPFTDPHGDVARLRRTVGDRLGALSATLAEEGGYAAVRAAHERDHRQLFDRVELDLGPGGAPAARQFHYGRYLLIASSRPGGPPANLQGLWNDRLRPPWSSNYTTNINLEMNYWPAGVANLAECEQPLLDWLAHARRRGAVMARDLYGASGWTLHHNSDLWCFCLPAGTGGDDACWSFWPLAGAWLSRQIGEHHDYTGSLTDRDRTTLREAAKFCLDWLVDMPDGSLGTSPATSPENHFVAPDGKPAAVAVSTTADLVLIRDLLSTVTRLGADDDDVVVRARAALARIPAERIGADGRLAEWSTDLTDAEPTHRHTSHLAGVYPGRTIDPDATPELAAAARRALDARGPESTGWALAWRVALRARLRDAEGAYEAVQRFLRPAGEERSGVYPNLFCAHPPFQIDGNFGFTAGVAEMLLQSQSDDTTHLLLLPALPPQWPQGAFSGLRARGGVTVDATWSQGEVRTLRLLSDTDRRVTIRTPAHRLEVHTRAGVAEHLHVNGQHTVQACR